MTLDISVTALSGNIRRSLAEKMYSAQFRFPQNIMSRIGSSYYWNPIIFFQPDYLGNQNPVFLGFFPSAQENLTAVGPEDETLTAYDYSWYLMMQYLPDTMVVMPYTPGASPGVMTPDVFILGCLGETLALNNSTHLYYPTDTNWNLTTKINPYAINVPPWSGSSAPVASQQTFTTKTTKAQAIEKLCQMLGWIFYVRWLSLSGVWTPCAWFIDQDNIDLPTASGGLGLPATVNLTNPITATSPPASSDLCWFLSAPATMTCQGDDQYNIAIVRYKTSSSASWSQGAAWNGNVYHPVLNPTGTVQRVEYVEESTTITTLSDANTRAAAILEYYGSGIVTWKMTLNLRSDLQLLQKIHISGYSTVAQGTIPDGDYRILSIENNIDQGLSVNAVTVSIISNTNFQAYLGLNKVFLNQVYEIQNIVQSVNDTTAQVLTGTVISRNGTVLLATVVQHDTTSIIIQAIDPTSSINTGTVQLTPDASGNYIATQGIAVGGAANDVNTGTIKIAAAKVIISGDCTFISGYDPSSKTAKVGGTYDSASSGPRVRIFPDANTGILITDGTNNVFTAIVGGTDVGDITIGDYANGKGIKWDKSAGTFSIAGILEATQIKSGSTLTVVGNLQSTNYSASSPYPGWLLNGSGDITTSNIVCRGTLITYSTIDASGTISGPNITATYTFKIAGTISDASAGNCSIYSTNGLNLHWKDQNGTVHWFTFS